MRQDIRGAAVTLALVTVSAVAAAQQNAAKIGAIYYQTHARTDGISGIGVPPGADAEVGNATTLLLTYERAITPHIGVELVLGIPPKIKAKASGSVAFLGDDVLTAKIVAPTLLVNYHFGSEGDRFRPYLGAGVNYTKFTNIQSRLASDVDMSDSTGLALQVGFDYAISKEWGLFASIAKVDVKSRVVASGATVLTTNIDFRPITYSFGAAYRF